MLAVATAGYSASAAQSTPDDQKPKYVEGQVIVRFPQGMKPERIRGVLDARAFRLDKPLVSALNLYLVKLKGGMKVSDALRSLRNNRSVVYAQADHITSLRSAVTPAAAPNDALFGQQWALSSPSTQVDIRAPQAWEFGTGGKDKGGNDLVVAIVDGGVDLTHQDLVDNLWKNAGEVAGNGIDDDGNGYVDDIHGWNGYDDNGNVPTNSHGTHVAGIVGARGGNGLQVAGVNWSVKLMAISASSGETSVILSGYGYALDQKALWLKTNGAKGANVVSTNSSFGVDYANCANGQYPVWNDIYNKMGEVGILSAAAGPNIHLNVDTDGDVPTGCTSDYIISVTNTTRQDVKNSSAGYGLKSIDLGAPGTDVLSTLPRNRTGNLTGTSMATPHVAGAVAFMHSVASADFHGLTVANPASAALELKSLMLSNVDELPSLRGVTVSNGRLNLHKAAAAIKGYTRSGQGR